MGYLVSEYLVGVSVSGRFEDESCVQAKVDEMVGGSIGPSILIG